MEDKALLDQMVEQIDLSSALLDSVERVVLKKKLVLQAEGQDVLQFLEKQVRIFNPGIRIFKTNERFNVEAVEEGEITDIINLQKLNDAKELNAFMEAVNSKLPMGGTFTCCVETLDQRMHRIFRKIPWGVSHVYYGLDFLFKRVAPKLPVSKQVYKKVTAGRNHAISKAELLGRLIYSGFQVEELKEINNLLYVTVRKIDLPSTDKEPSRGLILRIPRVGLNGKEVKVFKFRTMHPYAQYLQAYVYETNSLQEGGKFKNDFRVTSWGRFMRKTWIDELPMLWNLVRGDLKIVGVRPLSQHYLSLYDSELQSKRTSVKPGLVPPFYADLPSSLDEIMESEKKYIDAYQQRKRTTDWKYFRKAVFNIVFKRARSN